ncbi:type VI secretion system baseplate subunit TssE [Celerinatantimonas sp. MCCC 1A17872]|uniref:type VI secretion system baseplate subunit TssE n=1 Tax=Celerinatantimonas sp. MCCC 1A17872 TaxID=3177514 RepID=UPI0038C9920C
MGYVALEESAYGVSFFERLEADSVSRSITQGPSVQDVLESIKHNVANILNTRMGESLSAPELGLIDFNDAMLESSDLSMHLRLAIRRALEHYEPRLCNLDVQVHSDPDRPIDLRFHVTANVNRGALHHSVQIELVLENSRKYKVL